MADFGADTDTETFRAEARAWLNDNFPRSLAHQGRQYGARRDDARSHRRR